MTNDSTLHIALAADENYRKGLLVTAGSLAEHASRTVALTFHILDGGLTEATWAQLASTLRDCHPNVSLKRLKVADGLFSGLPEYHGSQMTYARLALPKILPDIDRCVYCDVDFLWLADVAELWREMRDEDVLVSVAEPCGATLDREAAWCKAHGVRFCRERYACAGLSYYNLKKAREIGLSEKTIAFLNRHPDVPFVDQTAINAVLCGEAHLVDPKWERLSVVRHRSSVVRPAKGFVLHFAGDAPWRFGAPSAVLTDVRLLWHDYFAKYAGISRWQSLRECLSIPRLAAVRGYWHLIRCPLTRAAFFAILRLTGHPGCIDIMRAKCLPSPTH